MTDRYNQKCGEEMTQVWN